MREGERRTVSSGRQGGTGRRRGGREPVVAVELRHDADHAGHAAQIVAIDGRLGVTTGISASDRAITILTAIDQKTRPQDLARPGHIFPLRYREGGVLRRAGHTEAAIDLARLAGLRPAGVIAEIVNDDGSMSRLPALLKFAKKHKLKICTVADLIEYRRTREKLVERVEVVKMPTDYGDFDLHLYRSRVDGQHHLALVRGEISGAKNVLVRVHSECLTGDVFGSRRCDCGPQLHQAMKQVSEAGRDCVRAQVRSWLWRQGSEPGRGGAAVRGGSFHGGAGGQRLVWAGDD